MKQVPILTIAICALLVAGAQNLFASGAIFANSAADGGRLIINRSPSLGHNVSITLRVDGKLAGLVSRGRTFERYLTPGQHNLTASPNRSGGPWHGTLNVRVGETYSYTASFNVDQIVLTPTKVSR
jgi:hypothetical protein